MLPFNNSAFSNTLGASDRTTQCKALIAPFKEEFKGKVDDVLNLIAVFNQHCEETGVIEDFNFVEEEHSPPSDVDMSDPKAKAAWLADPSHLTFGNILIDSSMATLEKLQKARNSIHYSLKKFTSAPDPVKMPEASKKLVSFQNRQWIYVLLQNVWAAAMKAIISCFQEQHDQDSVVLWFCFLQNFAGNTTKNLFEAYSQLSESKLQPSNFHGNVINFTNAACTSIHRLHKANETPSFQHFLYVFHGAMDAPNEEFRTFVINLYADYRKGSPTSSMSMQELLNQLNMEYNRINDLGRWVKKDDSRVLALMATISTLQTQLSSLKNQYSSLHALIAQKTPTPTPTPTPPTNGKFQEPPLRKEGELEITEHNGYVWKCRDKWFNGC